MRYPLLEVPQVAPLHLLNFAIATFNPMTSRDDTPLNSTLVSGTEIYDGMSLPLQDRADQPWPKETFLLRSIRFKFTVKLVSRGLSLLHSQKRVLFIHEVFFVVLPWEG